MSVHCSQPEVIWNVHKVGSFKFNILSQLSLALALSLHFPMIRHPYFCEKYLPKEICVFNNLQRHEDREVRWFHWLNECPHFLCVTYLWLIICSSHVSSSGKAFLSNILCSFIWSYQCMPIMHEILPTSCALTYWLVDATLWPAVCSRRYRCCYKAETVLYYHLMWLWLCLTLLAAERNPERDWTLLWNWKARR